jgi:hypothetical protein
LKVPAFPAAAQLNDRNPLPSSFTVPPNSGGYRYRGSFPQSTAPKHPIVGNEVAVLGNQGNINRTPPTHQATENAQKARGIGTQATGPDSDRHYKVRQFARKKQKRLLQRDMEMAESRAQHLHFREQSTVGLALHGADVASRIYQSSREVEKGIVAGLKRKIDELELEEEEEMLEMQNNLL